MNTPLNHDDSQLRYAEFVLGVLDADARAAVAHELQTSDEAATAVKLWHRRLQPMIEEIAPVEPPDHVWTRIQQALRLDARERAYTRPRLWDNLRFWHWFGLGASALAAACLLLLFVSMGPRTRPGAPAVAFMASTITQTNGQVGWTATMDIQQARIIVVPVAPTSGPAHRARCRHGRHRRRTGQRRAAPYGKLVLATVEMVELVAGVRRGQRAIRRERRSVGSHPRR
jgi:anti-sigma-K factor RskA